MGGRALLGSEALQTARVRACVRAASFSCTPRFVCTAPAATARGGGRGSGVSAAKAPAAVGWTVDEFLANQSDSDDSEDTKVAKRRKRSEMKQKLREARERA